MTDLLIHELRLTLALLARERNDMEALIDSISEGIVQLGPGGVIARVNQTARDLLGLPTESEGSTLAESLSDDSFLSLLEGRGHSPDGLPREIEYRGRRLLVRVRHLPEHLGVGTVVVLLDLTELQRFEVLRRDFVANASHELKTPLTSIRGYTELLLDQDPDPEVREYFLERILHNSRRLERLVDDLLDLSRLDSAGWRPRVEPVDLTEIVREAWMPLEERAGELGIRLSLEMDIREVLGDEVGLTRVFSNIFDNALRHTPEGGSIQVRTSFAPIDHERLAQEPGGPGDPGDYQTDRATIEITDTGTGIPAEAIPRIFERFYRVDPARTRYDGGTGLGLSIVKHLVERMNGTVTATSEPKSGTTIMVHLPVPPPDRPPETRLAQNQMRP